MTSQEWMETHGYTPEQQAAVNAYNKARQDRLDGQHRRLDHYQSIGGVEMCWRSLDCHLLPVEEREAREAAVLREVGYPWIP